MAAGGWVSLGIIIDRDEESDRQRPPCTGNSVDIDT